MADKDHEVIYLAPKCHNNGDGRTWCQDDAPEDCECPDGPHPWIKFIRADIAATLADMAEPPPELVEEAAWGLAIKLAHRHGDKPEKWLHDERREEAIGVIKAIAAHYGASK